VDIASGDIAIVHRAYISSLNEDFTKTHSELLYKHRKQKINGLISVVGFLMGMSYAKPLRVLSIVYAVNMVRHHSMSAVLDGPVI